MNTTWWKKSSVFSLLTACIGLLAPTQQAHADKIGDLVQVAG
jgi:hypothetical protein